MDKSTWTARTQYLRKTTGQYPSIFKSVCAETHFYGDLCARCGTTLRYRKKGTCVECTRKSSVEFYRKKGRPSQTNPTASRRSHLKRAFGITPEQFDELFLKQDNKCAICRTDTPSGRGWHVDHCHASGKIRGILCHHCNVILGHAKDSASKLQACVGYLNRHASD
jgi:hypothetical protein